MVHRRESVRKNFVARKLNKDNARNAVGKAELIAKFRDKYKKKPATEAEMLVGLGFNYQQAAKYYRKSGSNREEAAEKVNSEFLPEYERQKKKGK